MTVDPHGEEAATDLGLPDIGTFTAQVGYSRLAQALLKDEDVCLIC